MSGGSILRTEERGVRWTGGGQEDPLLNRGYLLSWENGADGVLKDFIERAAYLWSR